MRKAFLEKRDLTLTQLMDIARAKEAAERQANLMEGNPASSSGIKTGVCAVTKNSGKPVHSASVVNCTRCGRKDHSAKDPQCPARDKTCRKCSKTGHFAAQCKSKVASAQTRDNAKFAQSVNTGHTRRRTFNTHHNVNTVDDSGEEYAFTIGQSAVGDNVIDVIVGGVELKGVLIDSGASVNVVDQDTWEMLKKHKIRCQSHKSDKRIYSYASSEPLKIVGTFSAIVQVRQQEAEGKFVVIEAQGRPLLGYQIATDLGVLKTGLGLRANVNTVADDDLMQLMQTRFPTCFQGVGKLKDYQLKLHIDPEIRPIAQPVRRVPFSMRKPIEQELAKLIDMDIIEKAEGPTPWVSPILTVPKRNGEIHICVDMRAANDAVIRERHPIPTVDEVLHNLNGSTVFSRLDLKWGFHQVELSESSRSITTFVTHAGLYRYKRLFFGISSGPEKYQQIIQQVLSECTRALNIADDIVVHGANYAEHDERLMQVMECLARHGLTLNKDKCVFRLSKLEFMGHVLSNHGIGPAEDKVRAIQMAREPQNAGEVRSWLGLVNFVARYIPDLATISEPLRQLTRRGVDFVFGDEQRKSFQELKRRLCSTKTLAYFSPEAKTQLITNAGPVGLGGVLIQIQDGVPRAICYVSRALTDVERKYSQTEKEALAIVWACERLHLYLYGIEFELLTDHKPLEMIYSTRSKPSARIERWVLRLQQYNFVVKYITGPQNLADPLSRLSLRTPAEGEHEVEDDGYVRFVAIHSTPRAVTTKEIEQESATDELGKVRDNILSGDWRNGEAPEYRAISTELCCLGKLILRGTRMVIPRALRPRLLEIAHEGHPGIVQMKQRLRTKVWWPKIDRDAEKFCRSCFGCQVVSKPPHPEPMARTQLPDGPWQDLAIDYLGPLPTGEYVFVAVDYYSRWYEVNITKSPTAEQTVRSLKKFFATHGLPYSVTSDNGPQFTSQVFADYLSEAGICHHKTTPYWPQANGEVERQNRSLLQRIRIAQTEGKNWRDELLNYLMCYRSTPHTTTGVSPAEALFKRSMRTKLPELSRPNVADEEIRERDSLQKMKGKEYGDERQQAAENDLSIGDTVLVQQPKQNKLSTTFSANPHTVVARHGSRVTVRSPEGVDYKRNVTQVKQLVLDPVPVQSQMVETHHTTSTSVPEQSSVPESVSVQTDRPTRDKRLPERLKDYQLNAVYSAEDI